MSTNEQELDYESDITIDETALDVEWLEQAPLALRYGRHVAAMRRRVNHLDEKKKVTRSELIRKANEDPRECCGKDKPNAADIEAYYRAQPEYQQVVNDLLDAQYELDYAEMAKNEIAFTRKAALENLVRLHGQQYFAGPSVPRDLAKEARAERQARQRRVDQGVRASTAKRTDTARPARTRTKA